MSASPILNDGSPLRPLLIVEDNDMDLDFCLQALVGHAVSNPVIACRDGEEALQFIEAHGSREDPELPLVPFVILTTSSENVDIARAYDLGANSYLVKPVDFASFANVVKQIKVYWILTNQPPYPAADRRGP